MLNYFVAFRVEDRDGYVGSGRIKVNTDKPITSLDAIVAIEDRIKKGSNYKKVVITFWRRFEEDAEDDR